MNRLMTWIGMGLAISLVLSGVFFFHRPPAQAEETARVEAQAAYKSAWAAATPETLAASRGCLTCHDGAEKMHAAATVKEGCTDCHGGNAEATIKELAHVLPRDKEFWATSRNPQKSYARLNAESAEFIQFMNPGDLRVVHKTCGKCHEQDVLHVRESLMAHSAMVPGAAAYNNGLAPLKNYVFGEHYNASGYPEALYTVPPPTPEELKRGVRPFLLPLPDFARTFPGNPFRVFEDGNNGASLRGPGTEGRVEAGFIALQKTRLNDPYLSFLGENRYTGDYRSSGCSACHVIYANSRDPMHSGQYAKFGHVGRSATADPTIPKDESGHPIRHEMTRAIPSSQCIVCHYHQGSGMSYAYFGYYWWDYETDADRIYTDHGHIAYENYPKMKDMSAQFPKVRLSDASSTGWLFRTVYKQDIRGNLLDRNGQVVSAEDPEWDKKALHLVDAHAEKGMHCIDCHFKQDSHGDGKLYGEMINAIEIACQDCHGTFKGNELKTSNPPGGNSMEEMRTPWGKKAVYRKGKKIVLRSRIDENKEWELPQQLDRLDPQSPDYNEKMALAHTMQRDGKTWGVIPDDLAQLAHRTVPLPGEENTPSTERGSNAMTCYACHTSWVTNCYGCHLPNVANVKKKLTHYWPETTFNEVFYYPQTLRTDGYLLGIDGTVRGNRVSPVRSASAVVASAQNRNRDWVFYENPTISAEGFSGHALTPFPPHTVRSDSTKQCTDCHLSAAGDNNAKIGQLLGLGTNGYNFVGKYAFVAADTAGVAAVEVAEGLAVEPVIGSQLHSVIFPESYQSHVESNRILENAYKHNTKSARKVQRYGEYLFVADGPGGVRVFDIANVANKNFAQRLIEEPFSPLGHQSRLRSPDARSLAFASNLMVDPTRTQSPDNQEQKVQPIFGCVYVADGIEGLVVYDVVTYIDGNPQNNFPRRLATFNPEGALTGSVDLKIVGNYAYVLTEKNGLVVVDVSQPSQPRLVAKAAADQLVNPKALAVQFRYVFVVDAQGLKVFDVTLPDQPAMIPEASLAIEDARDIYVSKLFAYVAAGAQGLVIVDIERPAQPKLYKAFNADGQINDASGVVIGMTNVSLFAYIADGRNGLRIVQLICSKDPGHLGFSPYPADPQLIATYPTRGRALAVSEGISRDRYVDESGNQINVFGRLGSRPFTLKEMQRMYLRGGKVWAVTDGPPGPRSEWKALEEKKEEPEKEKPGRRPKRR
ncbi:MAG: hypothetical protein HYU36_21740 [Planctomycetes bacterium]|nr:hypothetical protein [Planctomycetota bacterium]